jgi:hypothetical protein
MPKTRTMMNLPSCTAILVDNSQDYVCNTTEHETAETKVQRTHIVARTYSYALYPVWRDS